MSQYLIELIRDNKDFKKPSGTSKTATEQKMAIRVIFKGDRNLYALLSRLWEIIKMVSTPHMSGYLVEPSGYHKDFKRAIRDVKNGETSDFQRRQQS